MKTGIIGGTFNPIHSGHLSIAQELAEKCQLDRVIFVPAAIPPHKDSDQLTPFNHRLAMVECAIAPHHNFTSSDIENQRAGKSYTVDTLQHLRKRYPTDQFYFLIGMDSLAHLHKWYKFTQIFELCHLVVARRPQTKNITIDTDLPVAIRQQFCYDSELNTYCHRSGNQLIFLEDTFLDISSTQIRAELSKGNCVKSLLSSPVAEYIQAHQLYVRPER